MRTWLIIAVVLGLIVLLKLQFPYAAASDNDHMQLMYLALLLVVVGAGSVSLRRAQWSQSLKYAAIWIVVIGVLVLGYSYRNTLLDTRLGAELMPNRPRVAGDGSMSVRAGEDGHFHVEGEVNGVPVLFMVDTGATDIVLTPRDAKRAGFDVDSLNFTRSYQTANGYVSGAPVRLSTLVVGPVALSDVPASVNKAEMDQSLLGLEFLGKLNGYSVDDNILTLRP